jgi:hypothetical protein
MATNEGLEAQVKICVKCAYKYSLQESYDTGLWCYMFKECLIDCKQFEEI